MRDTIALFLGSLGRRRTARSSPAAPDMSRCAPASTNPRSMPMPRRTGFAADLVNDRAPAWLDAGRCRQRRRAARVESEPLAAQAGAERHRVAVHAVAQAGRLGPVLEHVAQVPAAIRAMHFGARVAELEVGRGADPARAAAGRSSASRCRCRTWWRTNRARCRTPRSRTRPCGARRRAASCTAARCLPGAGSRTAPGSAASSIRRRCRRLCRSWPRPTTRTRRGPRRRRRRRTSGAGCGDRRKAIPLIIQAQHHALVTAM